MAMEDLRILEEEAARNQGRPTRYEQESGGTRKNLLPPRKNGGPPTPSTTPAPSTPQGQSLIEKH